ncbi:MAG: beta-lactamase family protein [Asgard group archaeon]|nr:beta-lactamase family protein [Asgard group archaeon]
MIKKRSYFFIISILTVSFCLISVSNKKLDSYELPREFCYSELNFGNNGVVNYITNPNAANITQIQTFFNTKFNQLISQGYFPGASVAVVNSTNILHYEGYGYADIDENELVNPNSTIIRIGSVAKAITWTAVMQLVEQGLIDLDADVNDYLDFKIRRKFNQPITMTHLISHSAGFEADWIWNGDATEETLLPLGEAVKKFQPNRIHAPGEFSMYSNYGAGLAGYIVSLLTGLTFEQYIEENIFDPLGMNYSTLAQPFPVSMADNFATEYRKLTNGSFLAIEPSYAHFPPASSLATTAVDMAQFMMAHLNNGTVGATSILEEATAYQMKQRLHSNDPRIGGWAYGLNDYEYRGIRILEHQGAVAYSVGGFYLLKDYDLGIYFSWNSGYNYEPHNFLYEFLDTFYPVEPVTILTPDPSFRDEGKKFTGTYSYGGIWETTPKKVERLLNYIEITIDEEGYLIYRDYKFVQVEDLLFRLHNGYWYIAFRENERGHITHQLDGGSSVAVHPKQSAMESLGIFFFLLISCVSIFLVSVFFYSIRRITYRVKKGKEEKQEKTLLEKLTNGFTFSTSLAYSLLILFTIIFLIIDVSLTSITLLNITCFLQYFVLASSIALLGFLIYSWVKKSGTLTERIIASIIVVASCFFIWLLFYWNFIGFFFTYGVWVPYGW